VSYLTRPPDLLIVMMDTVRQSDFPGGIRGVRGMHALESLRSEFVVYPRAVSPGNWTVPSHASVLTGMYPWEHGATGRGSIRLDPSVPQLPELLKAHGYRSLLLSSNFLVGPETGMGAGADACCWGTWWESYLRGVGAEQPPNVHRSTDPPFRSQDRPRESAFWRLVRGLAPLAHRYPGTLDAASRTVRGLRSRAGSRPGDVSSWIEPTLRRFLEGTPRDEPVFVMVNLLDAHEPYFPPEGNRLSWADWVRYATVPQDRTGWLEGRRELVEGDMVVLRELYRASILALDRRIAGLTGAFREAGRWDGAGCIVTSDHGQALGEQGLFYHMLRVDEAEVRIPLWMRFPRGEHGGTTARGWASLIDIAPTVLDLAGNRFHQFDSAENLGHLVYADRRRPVLAASDGLLWDPMARGVSSARRAELDRPWVAAYGGDWKLTLDVEADQAHLYDIAHDPEELRELPLGSAAGTEELLRAARETGLRAAHSRPGSGATGVSGTGVDSEIEERLRSWGYI
jgi:arylsulfatase A-like enzyme